MSNQLKLMEIFNNIPLSVKICGGVALCIGASAVVHSKIKEFQVIKKNRLYLITSKIKKRNY